MSTSIRPCCGYTDVWACYACHQHDVLPQLTFVSMLESTLIPFFHPHDITYHMRKTKLVAHV